MLNEIRHWEKRIGQYDRRRVNVVAAAASSDGEARAAAGGGGGAACWKRGRIVEAVPSSPSRIDGWQLYHGRRVLDIDTCRHINVFGYILFELRHHSCNCLGNNTICIDNINCGWVLPCFITVQLFLPSYYLPTAHIMASYG